MRTDYTRLAGVNYVPATTQMRDYFQALLTPRRVPPTSQRLTPRLFYPNGSRVPFGQFDSALVLLELKALRSLGFDSIRFIGSFTGWMVDRNDYLRNLEALLRHCECLGIGITFIIWNGIALPGFSFGLIDAAMATYNITIEQSIQSGSDGLHNSRFFTRYVPLRGTFFEAGPWGDPDGNLRFRRGGFARWGGVYPRLDREAELRLPIVLGGGIASAADLYLRDVASVFDGREGFLSYDLINEPEAWADSNGRMLPSAFELMTATYDVLRAAHSLTPPDFTVGVASSAMLVPVYNTLRASGRPMTYASFHDYSPRMYTGTSFYDELSRFRTQIGGLPLVCSEFYSPYHNPGSAWAHARGHLGEIARNLKAYGIGGQIWNVLEQNFFRVPRSGGRFTQTRPPADVEPSDGLFVPIEPRWGFQWRGRPRQLPLGGRFWSEYARDIQALIQSWTVSPTRSLVRPPNC